MAPSPVGHAMDRSELADRIDHTVLGPETTLEDVRAVLDEAVTGGMNACIPPCYVAEAREHAPAVTLMTVVGFPHGQNAPPIKREEAVRACEDGADELDLVVNRGRFLAGEEDAVRRELASVIEAVPAPVKVIVESGMLDQAAIRRIAPLAMEAGAAMLKTATGYEQRGARGADVSTLAEYGPVKASGGIRTYEEALAMLEAGAERIGSSTGSAILEMAPSG